MAASISRQQQQLLALAAQMERLSMGGGTGVDRSSGGAHDTISIDMTRFRPEIASLPAQAEMSLWNCLTVIAQDPANVKKCYKAADKEEKVVGGMQRMFEGATKYSSTVILNVQETLGSLRGA